MNLGRVGATNSRIQQALLSINDFCYYVNVSGMSGMITLMSLDAAMKSLSITKRLFSLIRLVYTY